MSSPETAVRSESSRWNGGKGSPLLRVEDIHTYYGAIHAIKGISP